MRKGYWLGIISTLGTVSALALSPSLAFGDGGSPLPEPGPEHGHCDGHDGHNCFPKTREVCFNVVCHFKNEKGPEGFESCKVASRFFKDVTEDGGEVEDDSNKKNNPEFEVMCGDKRLFHDSARRFTDLLGTRIQGETGPHPAITLPRGVLHTGKDDQSGDHVSKATLEIDAGNEWLHSRGECHIWTGAP